MGFYYFYTGFRNVAGFFVLVIVVFTLILLFEYFPASGTVILVFFFAENVFAGLVYVVRYELLVSKLLLG